MVCSSTTPNLPKVHSGYVRSPNMAHQVCTKETSKVTASTTGGQ